MNLQTLPLLGLWLLLSLSALAEQFEITFTTLPPNCTVAAEFDTKKTGQSGTPLEVTLPDPPPSHLSFRITKPGYLPQEVQIPYSEVEGRRGVRYPTERGGFVRLVPIFVSAVFHTTPGDARIWAVGSGPENDYLGQAGKPIQLNLAELVSGSDKKGFFQVRLTAAGYHPVEVWVPKHLFGPGKPNRWPAEGRHSLTPSTGWLARLAYRFRRTPILGAFTATAFLLAGYQALALWRRRRALTTRARAIESKAADPTKPGGLSGSRLGPYQLLEPLGHGATATVFRAYRDESDLEQYAVKVFHLNRNARNRLVREARPLLRLNHPNLVNLYDWGEAGGFVYLVTVLVGGRSLREELSFGPLERARWFTLVEDLLTGLHFAHALGVTHGDVKPENILVPWQGRAKLADFGLARSGAYPSSGQFGGTPGYIAPEAAKGDSQGELTDQYAAGVVLFEALFGKRPHKVDLPPREHSEVQPILFRMLEEDPRQRYGSLEAALVQLLATR